MSTDNRQDLLDRAAETIVRLQEIVNGRRPLTFGFPVEVNNLLNEITQEKNRALVALKDDELSPKDRMYHWQAELAKLKWLRQSGELIAESNPAKPRPMECSGYNEITLYGVKVRPPREE